MITLSTELINENTPSHIRSAAGIALKNALTARVRVGIQSAAHYHINPEQF